MANTVKNGKGPEIRKGANLKAYWEAEIWNKMGKRREDKNESIISHIETKTDMRE